MEQKKLFKLFLTLQVTGLVAGIFVATLAKLDPLAGMSLGLSISSVNFGISLTREM